MMSDGQFFDTLRQGLWVAVVISTPVLIAALVTGLAVGLLQALTSVQEMTLTFVPKVAVMMGVFWVTMGSMTELLKDYFQVVLIPAIVGF
ncbi:flagellar biosynthetic protein FliQ [Tropicimonas sp. S265A]|uniref:flagellar biosynthetic protein FliQ n=1 Tax=Tropicimonas sp. S265A TaxID=3415134 RepID=UPI003C7CEE26